MLKYLRLPPDYAQVLRELPDTAENPFYWRERRRGARHGEPYRSLVNTTFLLATVFGAAWGGLWLLLTIGTFPDNHIPAWLGGQDGGRAIFAVVAAVHGLIIYFTSRNVVNRVIAGEASQGTLFQLLMTRVPAFEMLAHTALYPFQLAAVSALAGLPFYVFLMSLNSVGIQEVFVLYLLLDLLAIAVPNWRTPAFGEQSPEQVGQMLRDQGRSAGCLATLMVFVGLPGSMMAGGILAATHYGSPQYLSRIPADVWPALVAFPVTGMWVIVRVLTAPYTWFGLPLPPWTWILPILFLYRISAIWMSSFYLRVAYPAQIARLPDARSELAFRRLLRRAALIGFTGAAWQPIIETFLPARLLRFGLLLPWAAALLLFALWKTGLLRRSGPKAQAISLQRRSQAAESLSGPPPSVQVASVPPIIAPPPIPPPYSYTPPYNSAVPAHSELLEFEIDGVSLGPPPIMQPRVITRGGHRPGASPAPPPHASIPPPMRDWRHRSMSPVAAAVFRWLARNTDNPVALYSTRRVLPGTLNSDQLAVATACGLLGLLTAYGAPVVFLAFILPWIFNPMLFQSLPLLEDGGAVGFAYLITSLVLVTAFSPMAACANVTKAFRLERDRSTLGFVLMTPLSSLNLAAGHMIGAAIPALVIWAGAATMGIVSAGILASKGYAGAGFWGWGLGFGTSLLFLALSVVTGAWIGITEQKTHDMTIGVYMLPLSMCGVAMAAAFFFRLNRGWSYGACAAVFLALVAAQLLFLWRNTLTELHKLRHGDVPFEGRIAAG